MVNLDSSKYCLVGSSSDAIDWVTGENFDRSDRENFLRFIDRFSSFSFVRGRERLVKYYEKRGKVNFPDWYRRTVKTLNFVRPKMLVQFDDFDFYTPRSDYVADIWYRIEMGSMNEEERNLFVGDGYVYPIGGWCENDRSILAIDLMSSEDGRIFEFSAPDLLDNSLDGKEVRSSVYPAFSSYASMLSHVVEGRVLES